MGHDATIATIKEIMYENDRDKVSWFIFLGGISHLSALLQANSYTFNLCLQDGRISYDEFRPMMKCGT